MIDLVIENHNITFSHVQQLHRSRICATCFCFECFQLYQDLRSFGVPTDRPTDRSTIVEPCVVGSNHPAGAVLHRGEQVRDPRRAAPGQGDRAAARGAARAHRDGRGDGGAHAAAQRHLRGHRGVARQGASETAVFPRGIETKLQRIRIR